MTSEKLNQQELAGKWVPEVGQEWLVDHCNEDIFVRCFVHGESKTCDGTPEFVYEVLEGDHRGFLNTEPAELFRPIQSKADKQQDEQIEAIAEAFADVQLGSDTFRNLMADVYNKGVRVLQPGQFVANELTDDKKKLLLLDAHAKYWTNSQLLNAVIAEMKTVRP